MIDEKELVAQMLYDILDEYEMEFAVVVSDDETYHIGLAHKKDLGLLDASAPAENRSEMIH
jgi:hypothetical protein